MTLVLREGRIKLNCFQLQTLRNLCNKRNPPWNVSALNIRIDCKNWRASGQNYASTSLCEFQKGVVLKKENLLICITCSFEKNLIDDNFILVSLTLYLHALFQKRRCKANLCYINTRQKFFHRGIFL